jgi:hypothetical protein
MINDTKKPSNAHKNTLKEEILEEITENFMEKILDMVNQNIKDALKKFQDTKSKEHEKTQKQTNELRGALNKHQSETVDTRKREINELKMKIQNINEEVTKIWKTSEKRNKKHSGKPLQQTITSGRQNLRTQG